MKNGTTQNRGEMGRKIPINPDIYRKNLDYYSGMGIYPEEICKEKALLASGYEVVKCHNFERR